MEEESADRRMRRYIRITDIEVWKLIDEISEDPRYAESFNLLINDALVRGLPILKRDVFGTVEEEVEREKSAEAEAMPAEEKESHEFYALSIQLLREILLNETLIKSMVAAVFNAKGLEYNGMKVPGNKFVQGTLCDTPEYLESYENRGIKKLRK